MRCSVCGLEYTDSTPDRAKLDAIYGENYFRSKGEGTSYYDYLLEERAMLLNAERRLKKIERFISPPGRLLDVGCATGVFLKAARYKWDIQGLELSGFASSYAREKNNLDVKTGTLKNGAYPDAYFDVVTMWDVVEHLADPLEDLSEANRIMKRNGLFVLTTGDVKSIFAKICARYWHLYNPAQHLSYFSKKTIELLLKKAGFRTVAIRKDGNFFTLSYLTSSIAMYYPSALTKALHNMVSKGPLKDLKFYINLSDIMTVYATKY